MVEFKTLFKPLTIKKVSIRNRIVMPAMNTNFAEVDGSVSERFLKYYVERGKGGAGLLIVSSAYIDPAARKRVGSLLIHDDRLIPKLRKLTDAVHATGARILQQINHNGRLLVSSKELKTAVSAIPVGPSAIRHLVTGEFSRALTVDEIQELIEKFGQGARRAKEAGFDGVEIHGSHGYLINEFFSRYSNLRTDEYGGTLENRMRFPLEVYRRVRELTGDDFLVGYRVSGREFAPVETPIEEVIAFCQRLEREGTDLLHVSAGNSETASMSLKVTPPGSVSRGCYADLAGAVKAKVGIPVVTVGRINTPEIAEQILQAGKADLVATGRALIADPHWPEKAFRGELDRIRRCIGCVQGCSGRITQEKPITCLYNPEVGKEGEDWPPVGRKKKVWVIGGGPGGMEAAVIAATRGHNVELYEKGGELGGQSLLASVPPGKEEFSAVTEFLARELRRLQVSIHLDCEMTAAQVERNPPDAVILATGSRPLIPKIPGVDRENVLTAWEVIKGRETGGRVVVAGGGLVGVETALFLSKNGKTVVLIEMMEEIARDAEVKNRVRLKEAVEGAKIEVRCKTELLRIGEKGVTVRGETGECDIPADTIVLALGVKAHNPLQPALEGKISELYPIGDCAKPQKMLEAIHEAYDVALKI